MIGRFFTWADLEGMKGGLDSPWKITSGYTGFFRNTGMYLLREANGPVGSNGFSRGSIICAIH